MDITLKVFSPEPQRHHPEEEEGKKTSCYTLSIVLVIIFSLSFPWKNNPIPFCHITCKTCKGHRKTQAVEG